jgi:hypothetical protein
VQSGTGRRALGGGGLCPPQSIAGGLEPFQGSRCGGRPETAAAASWARGSSRSAR